MLLIYSPRIAYDLMDFLNMEVQNMVARIAYTNEIPSVSTATLMRRRGPGVGKEVTLWVNAPHPFNIPKKGWPTEAPPGSVEKVLVMMTREGRGESLFHPYDSKIEGDIYPLLFYLMKWEEREEIRTQVSSGEKV